MLKNMKNNILEKKVYKLSELKNILKEDEIFQYHLKQQKKKYALKEYLNSTKWHAPYIKSPRIFDLFGYDLMKNKVLCSEGIIKSYNIGFVLDRLSQRFGLVEWNNTDYDKCYGYIIVNKEINPKEVDVFDIIIPSNSEYMDEIKKFCQLCGWYCSAEFPQRGMEGYSRISFEKEHYSDEEQVKLGDAYFHITPLQKVEKILRQGLCPKHNDKLSKHPSRVYLFPEGDKLGKHFNEDNAIEVADMLDNPLGRFSRRSGRKTPYAALLIDTDKCNNLKVFADPNFRGAVFTYDNIPPQAIQFVCEV